MEYTIAVNLKNNLIFETEEEYIIERKQTILISVTDKEKNIIILPSDVLMSQKIMFEIIENALNNKYSHIMTIINTIDEKTAKEIKNLTGIDVKGRKQVIFDNDIRHIINNHSNLEKESHRNQLPITINDIAKVNEIICDYDSLILGSINREGPTIRYKKNYDNQKIIVVEVIPKKNNLKIKTMWKEFAVTDTNPSLTSETEANNHIDK